jgi:hypothetical protein
LAGLCRSNKSVFVVGIHDARVLSDIRGSQKRLAALVNGDCLEMTEGIAHEIDGDAFSCQYFCACVGEDNGDCVEEHRGRTRQLAVRRRRPLLLAHNFLDLAQLFLNFTRQIFDFAFVFQVAVPGYFPDGFLEFTFRFVHLSFCVVLCA